MASKTKFSNTLRIRVKEMVRKFLVNLKKNPNMIPFSMLIISFLVYSLNLTYISNTTATIQGQGTGLCEFASMLFSILSMLGMLNAFPKRQKPNYAMIGLFLVLAVIIIVADCIYITRVNEAFISFGEKIKLKQYQTFMLARNTMLTHIILVGITFVATVLQPVYTKLIKRINTSVALEENNLSHIDLADEE